MHISAMLITMVNQVTVSAAMNACYTSNREWK